MSDIKQVFSHYYKNVEHLTHIDVYRVLELFAVTNPCVQHAVKKLLVAGERGSKDYKKDLREAIVSINRALEMTDEDTLQRTGEAPPPADKDAAAAQKLESSVPTKKWKVKYRLSKNGPWLMSLEVLAFDSTAALFEVKNQLEAIYHLNTARLEFEVEQT
jgi:hypothetical protein